MEGLKQRREELESKELDLRRSLEKFNTFLTVSSAAFFEGFSPTGMEHTEPGASTPLTGGSRMLHGKSLGGSKKIAN